MRMSIGVWWVAACAACVMALDAGAAAREPIIDMHLHAMPADAEGPVGMKVCAPLGRLPAWDQRKPYGEVFGPSVSSTCESPLRGAPTDDRVMLDTIAVMKRLNIRGLLGGTPERVATWMAAAPDRFFQSYEFDPAKGPFEPDKLRALHSEGRLYAIAEIVNQYAGIAPDDPKMAPVWKLAEEIDIPVGVHVGPGPPGVTYLGAQYRAKLSSALTLEDVLVKHPKLRLFVMHAGYPFADDTIALLYAHPQVHVEVGVINWTSPRVEFHQFLKRLVDAGFIDRIMFGSDQMVWPGAIEIAVKSIEEAPFLDQAQKRAILHDNAARFLRLDAKGQPH